MQFEASTICHLIKIKEDTFELILKEGQNLLYYYFDNELSAISFLTDYYNRMLGRLAQHG